MKTKFLSISSILRLSFQEIRNRFRYLFLLALIGPVCNWFIQGILTSFDPQITVAAEPSLMGIILGILLMLISSWGLISFVLFVCKRADSLPDVFLLALKQLPRFLGGLILYFIIMTLYVALSLLLIMLASFIFGINTWLGMIAVTLFLVVTIAGLLVLAVYLILLPYLLVLTDISVFWTFPAAYTLIKNHFWKTVGLLTAIVFISLVIYLICLIGLGVTSVLISLLIPSARYLFSLLTVIPDALALLVTQIPLIALYIDRSPLLLEPDHSVSTIK